MVVGKVDGHGDASKRVQRFATGVHDRFGVGSKECGSGVVIALSVEDRQVRIGYIGYTPYIGYTLYIAYFVHCQGLREVVHAALIYL